MNTQPAFFFSLRSRHLLVVLVAILCLLTPTYSQKKNDENGRSTGYYKEPFRPQFHFSPEEKWMNDPNGMVYENGIYHLFYQYYPEDIVWGPMHWGHASSKNLIEWEHHDIALYPDELGYIFSGSAVVDKDNSSGLGKNGTSPLVAIYTYHNAEMAMTESNVYQTQGIAYSNDHGKTWVKYAENPVLKNPGKKDFRDPKVFWHSETNQWIMTLAVGDHAEFYSSPDLKNWQFLSEFGRDQGAHGGVWECPDLIEMKVEGEKKSKWVLLISINPGGPNGGSATQYFVGDFDGEHFTTKQADIKWIDHGADNYAGVTYSNAPDGKLIFIGWMSNWTYAGQVPTEIWRSAMTLPRELELKREQNEYYLTSNVIQAFDKLGSLVYENKELIFEHNESIQGNFQQAEISWQQKLNEDLTIRFSNAKQEYLEIKLNPQAGQIEVDRSQSGIIDFNERFADQPHTMSILKQDDLIDIRLIVDQSSMELFMDQGRYVMTEIFFPTEPFTELTFSGSGERVLKHFKVLKIKGIWKEN